MANRLMGYLVDNKAAERRWRGQPRGGCDVSGFARQGSAAAAGLLHGAKRRNRNLCELERRSNRLAHFLRSAGLGRLDHYAIFMGNNARYVECCSTGERAGLYYTCVNSYLTPDEVAYILDNSESKILITSTAKRDVALQAIAQCPRIEGCLVVEGPGDGGMVVNLDEAVDRLPDTPIADEALGTAMLYSSGTTGRPKGILRPLPDNPPAQALPIVDAVMKLWRFREDMIHLSPAPLYHAAPLLGVALTIRTGGTAIVMEHFDPEQFLALVERYRVTHTQLAALGGLRGGIAAAAHRQALQAGAARPLLGRAEEPHCLRLEAACFSCPNKRIWAAYNAVRSFAGG
jgi:acyl-coenzyme A synthetase/AMP-(fatty) acid ligase